MKQIKLYFYGALVLAASLLAMGCLAAGFPWLAIATFLLAGGGWLLIYHYWPNQPSETVALGIYLLFAIIAAYAEVKAGWLLAAATAALATWDLHRFSHWQTADTRLIHNETAIAKIHLRRLALCSLLALLLGSAALLLPISLPFSLAFLLAVLAIWAISQAINQLPNE